MDDLVFTTRGYLPKGQVEMRESVVEDEEKRIVRTDKYDRLDGVWVGNDLHVEIKKMPSLDVYTGQIG